MVIATREAMPKTNKAATNVETVEDEHPSENGVGRGMEMAVDVFLKIGDGSTLVGESKEVGHVHEITVRRFDIGAGLLLSGANTQWSLAGGGKTPFRPLRVWKYVDSSSPQLLQKASDGTVFPSAQLAVRKSGGRPLDYLIYRFKGVQILSIVTELNPSEEILATEIIELGYQSVHVIYTPQKADGTAGVQLEGGWDLNANRPA